MLFLLPFLLLIALVFATNSSLTAATTSSEEAAPDEISSSDAIGWIVSFSAIIPPSVALFYTAMQLKNDSNARYIQTYHEIEKEIRDIENHEYRSSPAGSDKRNWWEITFLNTMDKNAFLMQSKKYPKDLLDSFKNDFGYALYIIGNDESLKRDYYQVITLCQKKQWSSINIDRQR